MICPTCKTSGCRRSHRRGFADNFLALLGMRPWRCRNCHERFRAWLVPARYFFYAHCPHCGNLDLQHVARNRVVNGLSSVIGRALLLPAYRCDDCRHRFFSLRRFHPIPAGEPQLIVHMDAHTGAPGAASRAQ